MLLLRQSARSGIGSLRRWGGRACCAGCARRRREGWWKEGGQQPEQPVPHHRRAIADGSSQAARPARQSLAPKTVSSATLDRCDNGSCSVVGDFGCSAVSGWWSPPVAPAAALATAPPGTPPRRRPTPARGAIM